MLIAAVALIVIGPEQLPTVMRAVVKIVRELRTAANEVMREITEGLEDKPNPPKPSAPEKREEPPASSS